MGKPFLKPQRRLTSVAAALTCSRMVRKRLVRDVAMLGKMDSGGVLATCFKVALVGLEAAVGAK